MKRTRPNNNQRLTEHNLVNDIFNIALAYFNQHINEYDRFQSIKENLSKKDSINLSESEYNNILMFFKDFVMPFAQRLSFYDKQMNSIDFDMHSIYQDVNNTSYALSEKGEKLIETLPKILQNNIKQIFRFFLLPWICKSYFVNRGFFKPLGYPGDYIIVEDMYNGNTKSFGLGYIYDLIFLETQLCRGLRNRKDYMKHIILNFITNEANNHTKILNVACGSSRELREIAPELSGNNASLSLLDADESALGYSSDCLKSILPKANIITLNVNVLNLVKENNNEANLDKYDLIYSIGLFDYLPDIVLTKVLITLLKHLSNNGIFVFAHKDHTIFNPYLADWFCDWKYYARSEKDMNNILSKCGIKTKTAQMPREKDGYIYFALINEKDFRA